ncbi:MAG: hypothetical protein KME20_16625 [Kaiparowitsia implicata GSE-PSE-MK54-09C]|jgi:uncharacterized protein YdeI (BOF family)|nr:hypothetical protein [Kaiparowitsia implicata GSE-PSE-MK54-09C]
MKRFILSTLSVLALAVAIAPAASALGFNIDTETCPRNGNFCVGSGGASGR